LEAVPDRGYEPGGWSGKACAKTAKTQPCELKMEGNEVVGASFVSADVVTITLNGSFGEVVATSPDIGTFTCTIDQSPCHPPIGVGQTAKFSVPADPSYQFAGWGKDCANFGLKSYCVLTIKEPTNITATFRAT